MKNLAFIICLAVLVLSCGDKDEKKPFSDSPYLNGLHEKAIKYPDSINFRLKLIYALDSAAMYKEANSQMDSLIVKDSLSNFFWFTKGQLQEHAKDTVNAIVSYNRSIRIYPTVDALLSLANLYAETANSKALEACAAIKQLYGDREHLGDAAFFEGVYHARSGNKAKAMELFNTAINFNYTLMDIYIEKGSLFYEDKNFAEALNVFKISTSINNTYSMGYYWQAKCYEAMNDKPNAISNYEKAFMLDNTLKEAEDALKRLR